MKLLDTEILPNIITYYIKIPGYNSYLNDKIYTRKEKTCRFMNTNAPMGISWKNWKEQVVTKSNAPNAMRKRIK